jgi:adenylate cyclase
VVLIGIDDTSAARLGKPLAFISPELATITKSLKHQGASAIGIDMILPDYLLGLEKPDQGKPGERVDPVNAAALGKAIEETGNVVLVQMRGSGNQWLRPHPQWRFKLFNRWEATDVAFIDLTPDPDQYIRRQRLLSPDGFGNDLHFGLALLSRATGAAVADGDQGLFLGESRIPVDAEGSLRINFLGPAGSFPVIQFREALEAAETGQPMPVDVQGAMVIIGVTARGHQDYHPTPYNTAHYQSAQAEMPGLMSGPELHAHVIATLADRAYIRPLDWLASLPFLGVLGAILGFACERLKLGWAAALVLAMLLVVWWAAVAALKYGDWQINVLPLWLTGVLVFASTFVVRWLSVRRILRAVRTQGIVKALEANPRLLDLRGEERVVTVLFADIRDFTPYNETHSPREVVGLLNAYFTAIVPIIEKHGGTLMQYVGDGIMVLFGAPLTSEEHAWRAVQTALAMVQRVHSLREVWAKKFDNPGFRIGIGIHTGSVIVGTVGSPRRLDYTAIGDTVNAAARIESENKSRGTEILISAETYRALPLEDRQRLGGDPEPLPVEVKGKKEKLLLHTIAVP